MKYESKAREDFARGAEFYGRHPTGQYDREAEHALDCFFEMLDALRLAQKFLSQRDLELVTINDAVANAENFPDEPAPAKPV